MSEKIIKNTLIVSVKFLYLQMKLKDSIIKPIQKTEVSK